MASRYNFTELLDPPAHVNSFWACVWLIYLPTGVHHIIHSQPGGLSCPSLVSGFQLQSQDMSQGENSSSFSEERVDGCILAPACSVAMLDLILVLSGMVQIQRDFPAYIKQGWQSGWRPRPQMLLIL